MSAINGRFPITGGMSQTNLSVLVAGLLWLTALEGSRAASTNIYYFRQAGWSEGGTLLGWFTAADQGGDGVLSFASGDVFDFSASLTDGNVSFSFTLSSANESTFGLVYDTDGGQLLGDYLYEGIMTGTDWGGYYRTGHAFGSSSGGLLTDYANGFLDGTPNPVIVYLVEPIPEPTAITLYALGGLSLLFLRRKGSQFRLFIRPLNICD